MTHPPLPPADRMQVSWNAMHGGWTTECPRCQTLVFRSDWRQAWRMAEVHLAMHRHPARLTTDLKHRWQDPNPRRIG